MNISNVLLDLEARIAQLARAIEVLHALEAKLSAFEELNLSYSEYNNYINVLFPGREIAVGIMKTLNAGEWEKKYDDDRIHYSNETMFPGVPLRLYSVPPPPGCKIITEEVIVAARTIPEHVETRKRIQCFGAELAPNPELSTNQEMVP